ncbi:MAG: hypothetical protein KDA37_11345, partial [Planctomycetales bacterium]|nr:hypothetical protein [Planctomycetales bacterium]
MTFGALPGGDATNDVDVAVTVSPGSIAVSGAEAYNFTGVGAIIGGAPLTKSGTGVASFANTGNNVIGSIALNGGTLNENQAAGGQTAINGNITGSGALLVSAGQVVLSGDNSAFSGAMTVNGGALNLNAANGLGGTVTINSGGRLLSNADTYTSTKNFTLNGGTLAVGGGAASAVTFNNTINLTANSSIQIDGGTGADGATVTNLSLGANTLAANVDNDSSLNVNGTVSGSGSLNKTGGGSMVMANGSSLAVSNVSVSGGSLDVSAMNAGAGLTLSSGQTLANGAVVVGDVTAPSGSVLRVGAAGLTPEVQYTYVDATTTNTTLADGSPFSPVQPGAAAANVWVVRGLDGGQATLGNGGSLYQADPVVDGDDAPALRTTIPGLTPNTAYDVQVNFWDADNTEWRIQTGSSLGSLVLYDSPADAVAGATNGAPSANVAYSNAPLVTEGNRAMYGAAIGSVVTDGSGNLVVFLDDFASGGDDRTWYDGVSYQSGLTGGFVGASNASLAGDLLLNSGASLAIDLAADINDTLNVTGSALLSGTLSVDLFGADPLGGSQFTVLTAAGGLDTTGLTLGGPDGGSFSFSTVGGTDLVLTFGATANLGDFNGDFVVDAADYT